MKFLPPQPRYRIYTSPLHYTQVLKECFTQQHLKNEDSLEELATKIKTHFSIPFALPLPTARFAIYLALKYLIKPGQEVILSPLTIVDVINMVICAGGVPVFADTEPDTGNIDVNQIAKKISSKTGAVLITHLHGLACQLDKIRTLCVQHQLYLIEDCAQAFTTRYQERYVGTQSDVGIFSFGMYKNVNSFYGGMLITPHQALYEKIKAEVEQLQPLPLKMYLKKFLFALATDISTAPVLFQSFTYWIFRYAFLNNISTINDIVTVDRYPTKKTVLSPKYRYKMMPLQARLILRQLDKVEKNNIARIQRADYYYSRLNDIPEIILPPMRKDHSHLYTYYAIQVPDRRDLMRYGNLNNRDWVLCHYHNCAALPCFDAYKQDCPQANQTARSLIYLPTYPRYSFGEVEKNIKCIRDYFGK